MMELDIRTSTADMGDHDQVGTRVVEATVEIGIDQGGGTSSKGEAFDSAESG